MIECYFDCSSPWTWLGFRNLRTLAAELSVPVQWKPVLVGGLLLNANEKFQHILVLQHFE